MVLIRGVRWRGDWSNVKEREKCYPKLVSDPTYEIRRKLLYEIGRIGDLPPNRNLMDYANKILFNLFHDTLPHVSPSRPVNPLLFIDMIRFNIDLISSGYFHSARKCADAIKMIANDRSAMEFDIGSLSGDLEQQGKERIIWQYHNTTLTGPQTLSHPRYLECYLECFPILYQNRAFLRFILHICSTLGFRELACKLVEDDNAFPKESAVCALVDSAVKRGMLEEASFYARKYGFHNEEAILGFKAKAFESMSSNLRSCQYDKLAQMIKNIPKKHRDELLNIVCPCLIGRIGTDSRSGRQELKRIVEILGIEVERFPSLAVDVQIGEIIPEGMRGDELGDPAPVSTPWYNRKWVRYTSAAIGVGVLAVVTGLFISRSSKE